MRTKLLRWPALCLPALAAVAACNVITDGAPIWDMTWNVPAKSTSISVNTLLPAGVSAVGNGFQANVGVIAPIVRTIGTDCASCATANGQTIAKPAFTVSTTSVATLPSGVASATLVTDTIIVAVTNGYNFDPINPGGGAAGSIRLTATVERPRLARRRLAGRRRRFRSARPPHSSCRSAAPSAARASRSRPSLIRPRDQRSRSMRPARSPSRRA